MSKLKWIRSYTSFRGFQLLMIRCINVPTSFLDINKAPSGIDCFPVAWSNRLAPEDDFHSWSALSLSGIDSFPVACSNRLAPEDDFHSWSALLSDWTSVGCVMLP